jgi:hypothetical protein
MQDRAKFSEFMSIITEMFDRKLSKLLAEIYWKALIPFSDAQCIGAFDEIIISSRFFPKPVDIIEIIQGTQSNQATEAWLQVAETLRRVGTYRSVKFNNPVIHSIVNAMGGWVQMGGITVDEEKWKQKEFERLYLIMRNHDEHPDYLAGRSEIVNTANKYLGYIPEPVLIDCQPDRVKQLK